MTKRYVYFYCYWYLRSLLMARATMRCCRVPSLICSVSLSLELPSS